MGCSCHINPPCVWCETNPEDRESYEENYNDAMYEADNSEVIEVKIEDIKFRPENICKFCGRNWRLDPKDGGCYC